MGSFHSFGYHTYGGLKYDNPFEALSNAKRFGDLEPDIQFEFPAADGIDWTIEPEQTLSELYGRRAQRIRDEHNYLILMYSGGSDSHQVLMSFLNNGVFIDEVCTFYPMKWVEKVSTVEEIAPTDPLGLLYEYHFAALPGLKTLSLRSPKTKIRVVDTSDAYDGDMSEWASTQSTLHAPNGGTHGLYQGLYRARVERELQRIADPMEYRKVGVIYGVEKPHLLLEGRDVSVYFSDTARSGISHRWQKDRMFEPVMFYWGDLRITCKQAHIIKRAMEFNGPNEIIGNLDAHRWLIYPDWSWPYQEAHNVHAELLERCAGERAMSIARERTDYYNGIYAGIRNVNTLHNGTPRGRYDVKRLFTRRSKLYPVGKLKEEKSCSTTGFQTFRSNEPQPPIHGFGGTAPSRTRRSTR